MSKLKLFSLVVGIIIYGSTITAHAADDRAAAEKELLVQVEKAEQECHELLKKYDALKNGVDQQQEDIRKLKERSARSYGELKAELKALQQEIEDASDSEFLSDAE